MPFGMKKFGEGKDPWAFSLSLLTFSTAFPNEIFVTLDYLPWVSKLDGSCPTQFLFFCSSLFAKKQCRVELFLT